MKDIYLNLIYSEENIFKMEDAAISAIKKRLQYCRTYRAQNKDHKNPSDKKIKALCNDMIPEFKPLAQKVINTVRSELGELGIEVNAPSTESAKCSATQSACPDVNLQYVDCALSSEEDAIVRLLPYLLTAYIMNYSGNRTMQIDAPRPYGSSAFRMLYQSYGKFSDNAVAGTDDERSNYHKALNSQSRLYSLRGKLKHPFFELSQEKQLVSDELAHILWGLRIFCFICYNFYKSCPTDHPYALLRDKVDYKSSLLLLHHYTGCLIYPSVFELLTTNSSSLLLDLSANQDTIFSFDDLMPNREAVWFFSRYYLTLFPPKLIDNYYFKLRTHNVLESKFKETEVVEAVINRKISENSQEDFQDT